MSNKAGGKRPATTNSDISNHNMVSEVPPERPSVRVSPASKEGCQSRILGSALACPALSTGPVRVLRPEPHRKPASTPGPFVLDNALQCGIIPYRMLSSILGLYPPEASSPHHVTAKNVSGHCHVTPVEQICPPSLRTTDRS